MTLSLMMMVALAGACGAVGRYGMDHALTSRAAGALPWGTGLVNVSGSLALGLLIGIAMRDGLPREVLVVVGGGFLGAYTTFSTWMYESVRLIQQGAWRAAAVHLLGSILLGSAAAAVGLGAGLMWF